MNRATLLLLSALAFAVPFSATKVSAQPAQAAPVDAAALTTEAEALLDEWTGQPQILDLAARKLLQAFQANRSYAKTYIQICRLQIMAGYRYQQVFETVALGTAEKAILRAIELGPNDPDAYVLQGHLYTNMRRFSEAKQALQTAQKIGTDNPWLVLNWGALLDKLGAFDQASEFYRSVIAKGTTNRKAMSTAYSELTSYYVLKHQWDDAEKLYQVHIRFEPASAWVRGNYASWLANNGEFERAIPYARDALRLMEYGAGRVTLSTALYGAWAAMRKKGKDLEKAEAYFAEAKVMEPDLDEVAASTSQYAASRIIAEMLVERGLVDKSRIPGR
jgi:Tfp pilus assembly protein PilF